MLSEKITSAKNTTLAFVERNKIKLTVAATTVVCYKIHAHSVREWNTFLAEKGLTDEYYSPVDEFGNEL